jgi:hypothetical protein
VPALGQRERLTGEVRDWDVGGQAKLSRKAVEAHVVRARHVRGAHLRPSLARIAQHADARSAGDRLHDPHDLRRAEGAVVLDETRREVANPERTARCIERRLEDVGVLDVLQRADLASGGSNEELAAVLRVEERREDRLGIEAGKATPHDGAASIDERRELAVADQSEVFESHAFYHSSGTGRVKLGRGLIWLGSCLSWRSWRTPCEPFA